MKAAENIIYKLHVKAFTKSKSSKVLHPGTFMGIIEKIPYLRELGVNVVMLMPAYEFEENMVDKKNFWGYTNGDYFKPKESYGTEKGLACAEFKKMVSALHRNGIKVFMEFYFVPGINPYYIVDCLEHWVNRYKIDGVKVNLNVAHVNMLKKHPRLTHLSIIGDSWSIVNDCPEENNKDKRFILSDDGFMVTARKFLKGEKGQVEEMSRRLRECTENYGIINYIATHDTFSLKDMVTYDKKHNEANGHDNLDGRDENFSWNCGIEGPTNKKKIAELRVKQMKNAMILLLLSQGTPMIYAGDEMGHTTKGNNNPYCQDNVISYINWNDKEANKELFEFVKMLIKLRKEGKRTDWSLHGVEPWNINFDYNNRCFAIMYKENSETERKIYVAFNMSDVEETFFMPVSGQDKKWKILFSTDATELVVSDRIRLKPHTVATLMLE